MSGDRYLLDTNAIVVLLQGNPSLLQLLGNATWIGISVISQIEFLVFSGLTPRDRQLFQQFLQRVEVVGLRAINTGLIEKIIEVRQRDQLKLPDAAIAAMAIQNSANLVSADRAFAKVAQLTVLSW